MNPLHFGSDLADTQIWINPESPHWNPGSHLIEVTKVQGSGALGTGGATYELGGYCLR